MSPVYGGRRVREQPEPAGEPYAPPRRRQAEEDVERRPRVLLVDDEPLVLESLSLFVGRHFETTTAVGGQRALELLRSEEPFAVVVSDLRMPRMDGVSFLTAARELAPDTVRIVLTGYADLDTAMAAVNEGHIFLFLAKPCPGHILVPALENAVAQHHLITGERVLLQQTLAGSIRALAHVLAVAQPVALSRVARARQLAAQLAAALGNEAWQLDIAVMVSQIAAVMVPPDLVARHHAGQRLTDHEHEVLDHLPNIAHSLLEGIPRLEGVRLILRHATARYDGLDRRAGEPYGDDIPWGARALRAVLDVDLLECQGIDRLAAIARMGQRTGVYDPSILEFLRRLPQPTEPTRPVVQLALADMRPGMVVAQDITGPGGELLLSRGQEATAPVMAFVRDLPEAQAAEPVWALLPRMAGAS